MGIKNNIAIALLCSTAVCAVEAQDREPSEDARLEKRMETVESDMAELKKLKVSGYIQGQYQYGQQAASLKVGERNEDPGEGFGRFGIRRGRIKFSYEEGIASGVFQLDITERGVKFKDAYIDVKDPWLGTMAFRAGVFDRPFGYEISHSSSLRESPERSAVFQTMFPDERDLGGMIVLRAPQNSPWNILELKAGFFAGNGINPDTDNKKDFIGRLSLNKAFGSRATVGAGVSYYNGSVYQGTKEVYRMEGERFAVDDAQANIGRHAKREYTGFDIRLALSGSMGMTLIVGEYLFGTQPATGNDTKSPNYDRRPAAPTFIRKFSGGYAMLVQDMGRKPFSFIAKYDRYDPNTDVGKNGTGAIGSYTGAADIAVSTVGLGLIWKIDNNLRLTAYYEINGNERSSNLTDYAKDLKDNVLTLRMQYKF